MLKYKAERRLYFRDGMKEKLFQTENFDQNGDSVQCQMGLLTVRVNDRMTSN